MLNVEEELKSLVSIGSFALQFRGVQCMVPCIIFFCLVRLDLGLSYFFLIFLDVRIRIIFRFQPIRFD